MMTQQWDRGLDRIHLQVSQRSTPAYTYRQWKRDVRLWQATSSLQKNQQERWLLRQLKGESRTAAEVVMDDELIQDDGIDLIVGELGGHARPR